MKIKIKKAILHDKIEEYTEDILEPYGTTLEVLKDEELNDNKVESLENHEEDIENHEEDIENHKEDIENHKEEEKKVKKKRKQRKLKPEMQIVFDRVFYELNEIKKEINMLRIEVGDMSKETKLPILKDIKKEKLDIETNSIKKVMRVNGLLGDTMLFKIYYIRGELKPIKHINSRRFEYWSNGRWRIDENYGRDIMDIICDNFKMAYIRTNTIENFSLEEFVENQKHIFELNDEKYRRELLKRFIKVISD